MGKFFLYRKRRENNVEIDQIDKFKSNHPTCFVFRILALTF